MSGKEMYYTRLMNIIKLINYAVEDGKNSIENLVKEAVAKEDVLEKDLKNYFGLNKKAKYLYFIKITNNKGNHVMWDKSIHNDKKFAQWIANDVYQKISRAVPDVDIKYDVIKMF